MTSCYNSSCAQYNSQKLNKQKRAELLLYKICDELTNHEPALLTDSEAANRPQTNSVGKNGQNNIKRLAYLNKNGPIYYLVLYRK